jgi:hypothetical protein
VSGTSLDEGAELDALAAMPALTSGRARLHLGGLVERRARLSAAASRHTQSIF